MGHPPPHRTAMMRGLNNALPLVVLLVAAAVTVAAAQPPDGGGDGGGGGSADAVDADAFLLRWCNKSPIATPVTVRPGTAGLHHHDCFLTLRDGGSLTVGDGAALNVTAELHVNYIGGSPTGGAVTLAPGAAIAARAVALHVGEMTVEHGSTLHAHGPAVLTATRRVRVASGATVRSAWKFLYVHSPAVTVGGGATLRSGEDLTVKGTTCAVLRPRDVGPPARAFLCGEAPPKGRP